VVVGPPGSRHEQGAAGDGSVVPLLAGRGLVDGRAAAYVCRGMVCERPVTGVDELNGLLRG
ncbi:MAG: hypothetical protein ACRDPR_02355, partial [Nocardioidaceae bacterium]